jgi:hypothetical protein
LALLLCSFGFHHHFPFREESQSSFRYADIEINGRSIKRKSSVTFGNWSLITIEQIAVTKTYNHGLLHANPFFLSDFPNNQPGTAHKTPITIE